MMARNDERDGGECFLWLAVAKTVTRERQIDDMSATGGRGVFSATPSLRLNGSSQKCAQGAGRASAPNHQAGTHTTGSILLSRLGATEGLIDIYKKVYSASCTDTSYIIGRRPR